MIGIALYNRGNMGIYIKMHKLFELNQIGYYEVSTDNFGGCYFFIGINKKNKSIECYLTKDFSAPLKIIKFDNENEMLGNLPGVDASILGRVVIKALRIFETNNFPEYLDYAS
jgi:hypothetical protein